MIRENLVHTQIILERNDSLISDLKTLLTAEPFSGSVDHGRAKLIADGLDEGASGCLLSYLELSGDAYHPKSSQTKEKDKRFHSSRTVDATQKA